MGCLWNLWNSLEGWRIVFVLAALGHVDALLTSRACGLSSCENHSLSCVGADKMAVFDVLTVSGSDLRTIGPHGNLTCDVNNVTSTCRQGQIICLGTQSDVTGAQLCSVCDGRDVCLFVSTASASSTGSQCYSTCMFHSARSDIHYACLKDIPSVVSPEQTASGNSVSIYHTPSGSATYGGGYLCGVESGGAQEAHVTLNSLSHDCNLEVTVNFRSNRKSSLPCAAFTSMPLLQTPFVITMETASNASASEISGFFILELEGAFGQSLVVSCQPKTVTTETSVSVAKTTAVPVTFEVIPTSKETFFKGDNSSRINSSVGAGQTETSTTASPVPAGAMTTLDYMYLAIGLLGLLLFVIVLLIIALGCRMRAQELQKQRNRRHFVNLDLSPIESRDVADADEGQVYHEVEITAEGHYATPELVPRSYGDGAGSGGLRSESVYFVLENAADTSTSPTSRGSRRSFGDEAPRFDDVDTTQAVYAVLEPEECGEAESPECPKRLSTFKPMAQPSRRGTSARSSSVAGRNKSVHGSPDNPYDRLRKSRDARRGGSKHVYDHLSSLGQGAGSEYHHLSFEPTHSGIITENAYHTASVVEGPSSHPQASPPGGKATAPARSPQQGEDKSQTEALRDLDGARVGTDDPVCEAEAPSLAGSEMSLCEHYDHGPLGPLPRRKSDSTVLEDKVLRGLLAERAGRRHSEFTVRGSPLTPDPHYLERMAVSESDFSDSGREPSVTSLCIGEAVNDDQNELDIRVYLT